MIYDSMIYISLNGDDDLNLISMINLMRMFTIFNGDYDLY